MTIETALPSGAIGSWYADQATINAGNPVIPNAISVFSTPKNLLRAGRRLFANTNFYSASSATVLDNVAVCPDGLTQASELTGTGNFSLTYREFVSGSVNITLPAGTYTLAINAQRATGSNQSFALSFPITVAQSPTFIATAAWQRFAWTFTTVGISAQLGIISFDGATGATINICDLELFSGSLDLGPETLAGHLQLGSYFNANVPPSILVNAANGFVDFSTTGMGMLRLLNPGTFSTVSVSALLNIASAGLTQNLLLLEANNAANLAIWKSREDSKPVAQIDFSGTGSVFGPQVPLQSGAIGGGWHVWTWVYDGTSFYIYLDDTLMSVNALHPGLSATSVMDLIVNCGIIFPGPAADSSMGFLGLWKRALASQEVYDLVDATMAYFSKYYPVQLQQNYYFAEGDSITQGYSSNDPPTNIFSYAQDYVGNPLTFGSNCAVGGSNLVNMIARRAAFLALLPPLARRRRRKFIASVDIGANDLLYAGGGAAGAGQYAIDVGNYVDSLKAGGFTKVVVATIISNTGMTSPGVYFDETSPAAPNNAFSFRTTYNNIIKGSWGHGDGFIDFASNTNLGAANAGQNPTYFLGIDDFANGAGTHPTDLSQSTIMEPIAKIVLDGLFNLPSPDPVGWIEFADDRRRQMRLLARQMTEEMAQEERAQLQREKEQKNARAAAEKAAAEAEAEARAEEQAQYTRRMNEELKRMEQEARLEQRLQSLQFGAYDARLSVTRIHGDGVKSLMLQRVVQEHHAKREEQAAADAAERERAEAAKIPEDYSDRLLYMYRKRVKDILDR